MEDIWLSSVVDFGQCLRYLFEGFTGTKIQSLQRRGFGGGEGVLEASTISHILYLFGEVHFIFIRENTLSCPARAQKNNMQPLLFKKCKFYSPVN